ncbi:hypothetical protein BH20GEM1_BH20GEM1_22970 [soil metagenome]
MTRAIVSGTSDVPDVLEAHIGPDAELAFLRDLAEGRYAVEPGDPTDLARAYELCERYRDLRLGLVDGVVAAVAERLGASGIATLDERHFGAIEIRGKPLLPRDL